MIANTPKKPGRPGKGKQTEKLVVRLAEENTWGYRRIEGELKKLGHDICPGTIRNILIKHGLPPAPERKGMSWKKFIQSHMDVAWATDFFTEEVWTLKGLVTFYVLFFIHLGSRRVYIAGCTPNPNHIWTTQQARNFSMLLNEIPEKCRYIIHDRDASFLPFDFIIKSEDIKVVKIAPHAPMCNACAKRFVPESCTDNLETLHRIHYDKYLHTALYNSIFYLPGILGFFFYNFKIVCPSGEPETFICCVIKGSQ